jgi:hypothetical protein
VRRSSRKPISSRKTLQTLERFLDNSKATSIDRNNRGNALKSYFAPRKAIWDNNDKIPKRNKRKTCDCENCRNDDICDPPTESNSENLPQ